MQTRPDPGPTAIWCQTSFHCLRGLVCFLALALPAHGELVLTNFSPASPIKVMSIGDSITDDCAFNGAWRAPLQLLLDAQGIAFTNVGRYSSVAAGSFTKRRHEGFCGAVVAAPGVFGPVHNYASQDNYLLKIVREALTIPINRPDLVLVLIGANDLGHGRNPYQVATNDMAHLLSLIFSNVPNANVLLAKPTTLQDASLGYGAYATNVPVYNATLQGLVNQRRTSGQNVFLADMFSTVGYGSMFNSDHLHPNPAGLQAIAKEWFTRIQAITISTNQFAATLVNGGAVWHYSDRGQDLGAHWAQVSYDDSAWQSGPGRLGYGDLTVATTVSSGPDATNKYPTTYFRRTFVVPPGVAITNLNFRLARADGAAVWLNGQEAFRANLPGGAITYTNLALSATTGFAAHVFYPTNLSVPRLPVGTNLIAVELHASTRTNVSLGFDLEVIGTGYRLPPPTLSIIQSAGQVRLSWSAVTGDGYWLYSATNLAAAEAWTRAALPTQTNDQQIVVTQTADSAARFYRLQCPSF